MKEQILTIKEHQRQQYDERVREKESVRYRDYFVPYIITKINVFLLAHASNSFNRVTK